VEPSDEPPSRLQQRAVMERSPEFAAARGHVGWVLHRSTEPAVRSLAWNVLAIMAARLSDEEEQQACLVASERAREHAQPEQLETVPQGAGRSVKGPTQSFPGGREP
jgi:hypothetical protein